MEKKTRRSRQREMIYDYLLSTQEHPSAEMIYEHLKAEMPNLSLGTVYRNLKLLEETGHVRRVNTPQNIERYDARCDEHAHFVCGRCGSVMDLKAIDAEALQLACSAELGGQVQWMNVVFGGICTECATSK